MRITPILPITPVTSAKNKQNQFQEGSFKQVLQKTKQMPVKTSSTDQQSSFIDHYPIKN